MSTTQKTPKEDAKTILKWIIYIATAVLSFLSGTAV